MAIKKLMLKATLILLIFTSIMGAVSFYSSTHVNAATDTQSTWNGATTFFQIDKDHSYTYVNTKPGKEIQYLQYGTESNGQILTRYDFAGITNGEEFTMETGNNKNAELYYFTIVSSIRVPAYTTYSVKHTFTAGATRTVGDSRATAKMCFQLFEFLEGFDLDENTQFQLPVSKDSAVAGICNPKNHSESGRNGYTKYYKELLSAMIRDKNENTTDPLGGSESYTTTKTYTYENNTSSTKIVYKYFGFFIAKQYGSKYNSQLNAFCRMTTDEVKSTVRVYVKKDGELWSGRSVEMRAMDDSGLVLTIPESTTEKGMYEIPTTTMLMDRTYKVYVNEKTYEPSTIDSVTLGFYHNSYGDHYDTYCTMYFYTLTLEDDDGNTLFSQVYIKNEYPTISKVFDPTNNPTKLGHTFKGWASKDDDDKTIVTRVVMNKTQTLVPVWEATTYYVSLKGNGGVRN